MRVSHTRKREMRIIGARLTFGPNTLKFQAPRSLSPHLAIFQNRQVLSLFCRPRHCRAATACHPRSWPGAHRYLVPDLRVHHHLIPASERTAASSPTQHTPLLTLSTWSAILEPKAHFRRYQAHCRHPQPQAC
jgi:hypothetical protein